MINFFFSILGCSYAPNGFLLAAVASGGEIRLWDPFSGRSLQSAVDTHNLGINACTFSPLARQGNRTKAVGRN